MAAPLASASSPQPSNLERGLPTHCTAAPRELTNRNRRLIMPALALPTASIPICVHCFPTRPSAPPPGLSRRAWKELIRGAAQPPAREGSKLLIRLRPHCGLSLIHGLALARQGVESLKPAHGCPPRTITARANQIGGPGWPPTPAPQGPGRIAIPPLTSLRHPA